MGTSLAEKHRPEPEPDITPIPLMQLATAFWAFKTLSTAIDMDLFTRLETSPMNAPELARWLNIEERPAEMILTGCAGLGLLSKQNGRYRNTPLAENFLVRGARYYFGGFVTMLPVGTNFRKPCVPTDRRPGIPTNRNRCSKLPTPT